MRVGHGFDVHRFGQGDAICLGGVSIPHDKGLIAHSDGDVLLHALSDALLGAAALGDIGKHFPDTDPAYKDADSRFLLRSVYQLLLSKNYQLINCDVTVIAQEPKLAPHIEQMRVNIANDLATDVENVSVKATTTEGLGFEGRKEGISAHAVVAIGNKGE